MNLLLILSFALVSSGLSADASTPCLTNLANVTLTTSQTYTIAAGECPGHIDLTAAPDHVKIVFQPGAGYFHSGGSIMLHQSYRTEFLTVEVSGVNWEIRNNGVDNPMFSGAVFEFEDSNFLFQDSTIVARIHNPFGVDQMNFDDRSHWTMQRCNLTAIDTSSNKKSWFLAWGTIDDLSSVNILDSRIQYSANGPENAYVIYHSGQIKEGSSVTISNSMITAESTGSAHLWGIYSPVSPHASNSIYTIKKSTLRMASTGHRYSYGVELDNGLALGAGIDILNSTIESLGTYWPTPAQLGGLATNGNAFVRIQHSSLRAPNGAQGVGVRVDLSSATAIATISNSHIEGSQYGLMVGFSLLQDVYYVGTTNMIKNTITAPTVIGLSSSSTSLSGAITSTCNYLNGNTAPLELGPLGFPSQITGALSMTTENSVCPYSGPATPTPATPAPPSNGCTQLSDITLNVPGTTHRVQANECAGMIAVAASQITIIFETGAEYFQREGSIELTTRTVVDLTVIIQGVTWSIGQQYRVFTAIPAGGTLQGFTLLIQDSTIASAIPDPLGLFDWMLDSRTNVTLHRVKMTATDSGLAGDTTACFKFESLSSHSTLTLRESTLEAAPTSTSTFGYGLFITTGVRANSSLNVLGSSVSVNLPGVSTKEAFGIHCQVVTNSEFTIQDTIISNIVAGYTSAAYVHDFDNVTATLRNVTLGGKALTNCYGFHIPLMGEQMTFALIDSTISCEGGSRAYGLSFASFASGTPHKAPVNNSQIFVDSSKTSYTSTTGARGIHFSSNLYSTDFTFDSSLIVAKSAGAYSWGIEFKGALRTGSTTTIRNSNITTDAPAAGGFSLQFWNGDIGTLSLIKSFFSGNSATTYSILTAGLASTASGSIFSDCTFLNPTTAPPTKFVDFPLDVFALGFSSSSLTLTGVSSLYACFPQTHSPSSSLSLSESMTESMTFTVTEMAVMTVSVGLPNSAQGTREIASSSSSSGNGGSASRGGTTSSSHDSSSQASPSSSDPGATTTPVPPTTPVPVPVHHSRTLTVQVPTSPAPPLSSGRSSSGSSGIGTSSSAPTEVASLASPSSGNSASSTGSSLAGGPTSSSSSSSSVASATTASPTNATETPIPPTTTLEPPTPEPTPVPTPLPTSVDPCAGGSSIQPSTAVPSASIPEQTVRGGSGAVGNSTAAVSASALVFEFNVPFAENWAGNVSLQVQTPYDLFTAALVIAEGEQPNPGGFSKFLATAASSLDRGAQPQYNLTRVSATGFTFELQPMSGYQIELDETLQVSLGVSYFDTPDLKCPPVQRIPIFNLMVIAVPDPVAEATKTATAVVSGTAAAASVASAGAAMDAQSLAVLALMSCAQPVERSAMKNNRLLSPLAPGDGYEMMILGNFLLLLLVGGLHWLSAAVVSKVKRVSLSDAMVFVRFPTFTLVALTIQYQGTAAAGVKLVQLSSAPDASKALGGIIIAVSLILPLSLLFMARSAVTADFRHYDFASFPEAQRLGAMMKLMMPVGRWYPQDVRRRFSSLFAGYRRKEKIWVTLPTWSPTVIIIGLMFQPSSKVGCVAQFSTIAAVQFVFVVVLLAFRPYRSLPANILAAASNLCIGMVLVGSALLAQDPEAHWAFLFMLHGVQAQMAVTGLRLVWTGIQFAMEQKIIDDNTPTLSGHSWEAQEGFALTHDEFAAQGEEERNPTGDSALSVPLIVDQIDRSDEQLQSVAKDREMASFGDRSETAAPTTSNRPVGSIGSGLFQPAAVASNPLMQTPLTRKEGSSKGASKFSTGGAQAQQKLRRSRNTISSDDEDL